MRIIVLGIGAIGGTVAARLSLAGDEVIGIARGAQLAAIRSAGLRLRTPGGTQQARFTCVGAAGEISFRPDDTIIIATKTQHTEAALDQLRAAGVNEQPIFCFQNGVDNERMALRRFTNVHAVTVLLPAEYMVPGEVVAFGAPKHGIFDIGRYPGGLDAADHTLVERLNAAGFNATANPDTLATKYGKLLMNLGNIAEAAIGRGVQKQRLLDTLRTEGRAVLDAAGIAWRDVGSKDPRRQTMQMGEIEGITRTGSSSTQSLARHAGSLETDFLNGEIVLMGRLYGVPTPANTYVTSLAARMLHEGLEPGSIALSEVETAVGIAANP